MPLKNPELWKSCQEAKTAQFPLSPSLHWKYIFRKCGGFTHFKMLY
jgi:hypothetical protein